MLPHAVVQPQPDLSQDVLPIPWSWLLLQQPHALLALKDGLQTPLVLLAMLAQPSPHHAVLSQPQLDMPGL